MKRIALVDAKLVASDLAVEFELQGWEVDRLRPGDIGIDSFRDYARSRLPRFLMSINHSPELAWLCGSERIPYVSWTVDPLSLDRLAVLEETDSDSVRIFLHRSSQVPLFHAMGFPHVEWLPLAAPRRRFEQAPTTPSRTLPPSFIGSSLRDELSLFEQALARWGIFGAGAASMREAFDDFASVGLADASYVGFPPSGEGLPANLLERLGESAPVVAESVNARIAAVFRRRRVSEIAGHGVDVHGDEGWAELVGVRWKGALPDGLPLSRVYAESSANIDVPRLHQRDIATLRALDVAASGGCLVAEPSSDLVRLLEPGAEFVPYCSGEELHAAIDRLRRDASLSLEVGRKAAARARVEHSLESRAKRILEVVER